MVLRTRLQLCHKGKNAIFIGVENTCLFSGEAGDILLRESRLVQFYRDLSAKALVLVNPTELEIFYRDLSAKSLFHLLFTEKKSVLRATEISVPRTHYRNFCAPQYRKFL